MRAGHAELQRLKRALALGRACQAENKTDILRSLASSHVAVPPAKAGPPRRRRISCFVPCYFCALESPPSPPIASLPGGCVPPLRRAPWGLAHRSRRKAFAALHGMRSARRCASARRRALAHGRACLRLWPPSPLSLRSGGCNPLRLSPQGLARWSGRPAALHGFFLTKSEAVHLFREPPHLHATTVLQQFAAQRLGLLNLSCQG